MQRMKNSLALTFLLVLAFAAAGCGAEEAQQAGPLPTVPASSETAPTTETTPAEPEPETTPTTTAKAAPPPPASCSPQVGGEDGVYMNLKDVRVGAHGGFDRIVFEFQEPDPNPAGNGGIPRYEIRQAKPPFSEDPSDIPIDVEGDAFARIIFQGASGYDFDGNATYDGQRRLTPGFGTLAQVVEGGDFEATNTWILGLSRPTCWEIQALHNPERLVIDFHHV
jgi:predicted small lipoprotein YifL